MNKFAWFAPRLRAGCVHFALSFVVVLCAVMLVVMVWFPGALLYASGGVKLLALMIVVDLILGPILTFIVFDRRKKCLVFDLTFIVVVQISALSYGLYAAYNGRPIFEVFVVDRIELVSASEVDSQELQLAPAQFQQIRLSGPTLAAARLPDDPKARAELTLSAAAGIDVKHFLRYYVPYTAQRQAILAAAKPLTDLNKFNDAALVRAELAKLASARHEAPTDWKFVPLQGKREDLAMIIRASDATRLGTLRLRPWRD